MVLCLLAGTACEPWSILGVQFPPEAPTTTTTTSTTTPPVIAPPTTVQVDELQECIARWESENGATDSNVYQFVQSTWESYGGVGDPADATLAEQNRIFDLAWADAGPAHWTAQRGRCF